MKKRAHRVVQQRYFDESLGCEVTQYEPDPDEWPESRRFWYFASQKEIEQYKESDEDSRSNVDECGLGAEFGGTFVTETRKS